MGTTVLQWGEAKDTAEHLNMQKTTHRNEDSHNAKSAKVENTGLGL